MPDARDDLLAALEEKPEEEKMLAWQEIASHPRLEQYDAETIDAEVRGLEAEGAVRIDYATPSQTPYYFDAISLLPE